VPSKTIVVGSGTGPQLGSALSSGVCEAYDGNCGKHQYQSSCDLHSFLLGGAFSDHKALGALVTYLITENSQQAEVPKE
jgi:hypothetical protein